jgi:hypothetical protein
VPPFDLDTLLAADLSDATNRILLADALHRADREIEAELCWAFAVPIRVEGGRVVRA